MTSRLGKFVSAPGEYLSGLTPTEQRGLAQSALTGGGAQIANYLTEDVDAPQTGWDARAASLRERGVMPGSIQWKREEDSFNSLQSGERNGFEGSPLANNPNAIANWNAEQIRGPNGGLIQSMPVLHEGVGAAMGQYWDAQTEDGVTTTAAGTELDPTGQVKDSRVEVPKTSAGFRGTGAGGGGGLGMSSTSIQGPDARRLQALYDAQTVNTKNLRDQTAAINRSQQELFNKQLGTMGNMMQGYAQEATALKNEAEGYKMRLDGITDVYRRQVAEGQKPAGFLSKSGRVPMSSALLVAAGNTFQGGQSGVDFFNNLIDRDLAMQRSHVNDTKEQADSLLSTYERVTGDQKIAEEQYKATQYEMLATEANKLAAQVGDAETAAKLNEVALNFQMEKEKLKMKISSDMMSQLASARGRGGGGGGFGGGRPYGQIGPKEAQTVQIMNALVDDVRQFHSEIEPLLGTAERIFRSLPGGDWLAGAYDKIAANLGREEAIMAQQYQSKLNNMSSRILNMLSGAAVSPQEFERIQKFLPSMGDAPMVVRSKLRDLQREVDILMNTYAYKSQAQDMANQDSRRIAEFANYRPNYSGRRIE